MGVKPSLLLQGHVVVFSQDVDEARARAARTGVSMNGNVMLGNRNTTGLGVLNNQRTLRGTLEMV